MKKFTRLNTLASIFFVAAAILIGTVTVNAAIPFPR